MMSWVIQAERAAAPAPGKHFPARHDPADPRETQKQRDALVQSKASQGTASSFMPALSVNYLPTPASRPID